MDVLTTILTCSLYATDDALVRAIAEGPGESNPYAVRDAAAEPSDADAGAPPATGKEATARANALVARGGRPLLGLLSLPPAWLEAFGRPLEGAFDVCANVAIGTAMLSEFDRGCATAQPPRSARARLLERTNRRACVLRRYEAALGAPDFADAVLLELSAQQPKLPDLAEAPIFAPMASGRWGTDLFFPLPAVAYAPAPLARPPP